MLRVPSLTLLAENSEESRSDVGLNPYTCYIDHVYICHMHILRT